MKIRSVGAKMLLADRRTKGQTWRSQQPFFFAILRNRLELVEIDFICFREYHYAYIDSKLQNISFRISSNVAKKYIKRL